MLRRKLIVSLTSIICFVIIYLNSDSYLSENKPFITKETTKPTEESNKSLPKTTISTMDKVDSSVAMNNADTDAFECFPDFTFNKKTWMDDAKQYFQSLDADFTFDEEAHMLEGEQYLQSLDDHFSKADPLNYALFATPPKGISRLDLLLNYHNQFQSNPLVSLNLINLCKHASDKKCTVDIVNNLVSSDSNNGAIWLNVASFYAARNDDKGVMSAINSLEKTTLFNERYAENILLYAQALENSTSNDFTANVIVGIGNAAANSPAYGSVIQWCKQGIEAPGKANACLTLGQQLETRSTTLLSNSIGLALQNIVFESQSNTEAMQLVEKKKKSLYSNIDNELFQRASIMMMLDQRLLRSWLNNLDSQGEFESQRLLVEEAEVLYEENKNQLCTAIYKMLDAF
ncbi:hypothetical protein ESZ36_20115 [Colwellia demingiae]|uniref:Uncharacterized protein n=1 Tax=Colwellia demingiae TaxID=89401 RepID=A0A5C6Q5Y8_9GAMM|nr:hypothetical protein [Colwellia demingiae]TWX64283.1 hypothetical protein ESZ36_20115 [Colwellia demingiae]